MNLLFLNEYAPPHLVSGAERSMMALFSAFKKSKKLKIYLLSPNLGGQSSYLRFPFIKKIKPGQTLTPLWFSNPIFWLYSAVSIQKTIKKHHINLIHVHGKYIQPSAIIAGWLTKTPVITTVRDFKLLCPLALCYTHQQKKCSWSYYLKKEISFYLQHYSTRSSLLVIPQLILAKLWQYLLKWFLLKSSKIIAVSPQLAKIYQHSGVKKVTSIYNLPPKPIKVLKGLDKTIVSIGKLSYGKGTDTLLKAMEILKTKLPDAKLLLAGRKNISLKQSFPSNTLFLGQQPQQKVKEFLTSAQVFVILSRWPEPLSRAGLEALSASLAILASNRGGNQELVKDNGFLVNPDKPQEVAEKLIKLLTSKNLKTYQHNSHQLLKTRFNRKSIIYKHLKLYQSLV